MSNRIEVTSKVRIYETKGEEIKVRERPVLEVSAHWNRSEMVVLAFPDGQVITVAARDLNAAVKNATNAS